MSHFNLESDMERSAVFSKDRRHRYELWRRWNEGPYCMFVGLNPSTADENLDDPTIRRCIGFARGWGYSALCMANIFAFRATDPKDMKRAQDPVGSRNDETLGRLVKDAGIVIAAWGVHGDHEGRAERVDWMLNDLHCLGTTKDGHPRHPLYIKKETKPIPFSY